MKIFKHHFILKKIIMKKKKIKVKFERKLEDYYKNIIKKILIQEIQNLIKKIYIVIKIN